MNADLGVSSANLPYWMQLLGFILAGLLTFLMIASVFIRFLNRGILNFTLTREIIFRIIEDMEAIFTNGVLMGRNDGVLITKAIFKLNKIDLPTKSYNLRIAFLGEKVRGLNPISDFNFYTTSPISYIPINYPQRIVFLLAQESYEANVKKLFSDFRFDIYKAHSDFKTNAPKISESLKDFEASKFIKYIEELKNNTSSRIMESVQLEPGEYEITATVFYKTKKIVFGSELKTVCSTISFKIDSTVKEMLRMSLSSTLNTISMNILKDENHPIIYPEYRPIEVIEKEGNIN